MSIPERLEDLIDRYELQSLNVKYYNMPLYKDKRNTIHAIELFDESKGLYRIYLSWSKPIGKEVLENVFIRKLFEDKRIH